MVYYRLFIFFWLSAFYFGAHAQDLTGSVGLIEGNSVSSQTPYYVKVAMAIDEEYEQGSITVKQRPFSRSVREVSQGESDFQLPLICPKNIERTDYYDFLSEKVSPIVMALYSSTENPITTEDLRSATYTIRAESFDGITNVFSSEDLAKLERLDQTFVSKNDLLDAVTARLGRTLSTKEKETALRVAFPYKIETDRFHVGLFDIPSSPAVSIASGLRKVARRRIDGYLYAAVGAELVIDKTHFKHNFERSFFDWFDVCIVIGANLRGSQLDQDLSLAVKKFKNSPKYNELFRQSIMDNEKWLRKYGDQNPDKAH